MTTSTDSWIERVRAADAEAEACWTVIIEGETIQSAEEMQAASLAAIAAELRAQRIARRPGAGK